MGRKKIDPDELENKKARREAKLGGYEYRPTTRAQREEAERLNRGFEMLENHEADPDED